MEVSYDGTIYKANAETIYKANAEKVNNVEVKEEVNNAVEVNDEGKQYDKEKMRNDDFEYGVFCSGKDAEEW